MSMAPARSARALAPDAGSISGKPSAKHEPDIPATSSATPANFIKLFFICKFFSSELSVMELYEYAR